MTFEEANDRYLDILEKISCIEDQAKKDDMFNLAYWSLGHALRKCKGKLKPQTEAEIALFEKMLSDKEA